MHMTGVGSRGHDPAAELSMNIAPYTNDTRSWTGLKGMPAARRFTIFHVML